MRKLTIQWFHVPTLNVPLKTNMKRAKVGKIPEKVPQAFFSIGFIYLNHLSINKLKFTAKYYDKCFPMNGFFDSKSPLL